MPTCGRGLAWLLLCPLFGIPSGCGDDADGSGGTEAGSEDGAATSTGMGPANTAPTFEARVDAAAACGAGASALELRATRFGCVDPPPAPCTLPNPLRTDVGDAVACPSTETDTPLRLEVTLPGRYWVEVVTIAGDGSEVGECHSGDAEPEVLVDDEAFDANPTITVDGLGSPCPEP